MDYVLQQLPIPVMDKFMYEVVENTYLISQIEPTSLGTKY